MPALMVQGCTSWAGKSLLVTALCRWFARRGVSVAPFKSQNMSNNARVVDGGEIGTAQWLQAHAARVRPEVAMNPVLLKPEAGGSQVVRLGRVDETLSRRPWRGRSGVLWPTVEACLVDLLDRFELVVVEGAGSPAEINLAADEIVNMRVAERADAPVLLIVDIDRGGAFAHLYGTWALLPPGQQERIRGFVLNRFRGDATLLDPAPAQLERTTGIPTLGVLPMLDHDLPDEDGAALHRTGGGTSVTVAVLRYPAASNLDEFTLLEQSARVRWVGRPADLLGADLVVLPGSKHVASDLAWLVERGLDRAIHETAERGTRILGICGGLQLLGTHLEDPHGIDGTGDALGLLPVTTTFEREKLVERRGVDFSSAMPDPWSSLAGLSVPVYEIRHGHTVSHGDVDACLPDGRGWVSGPVMGVTAHGLLEDPDVLEALVGQRPYRDLDETFEALADALDRHLDMATIADLAGVP